MFGNLKISPFRIPYGVALISWICGSGAALIVIGHKFSV
jgi:hypothetical protein